MKIYLNAWTWTLTGDMRILLQCDRHTLGADSTPCERMCLFRRAKMHRMRLRDGWPPTKPPKALKALMVPVDLGESP